MLIDSHVHLTFLSDDEIERQTREARALGTHAFVEVATTSENAAKVVELAESRDDVYCGVAVHPWQVETYSPSDLPRLRDLIKGHSKIVCVGECGLDYSSADGRTAEKQRGLLRDMIGLARESGLPLNMHSDRNSFRDLLTILREEKAYEVGGMMHNYQGNLEAAREYLDQGFYVSVCVLIHHPLADRLRGVFRDISLGQLVMDSDAPAGLLVRMDHGDEPYPHEMDKVSEPRMLRYIAEKLADVKDLALEDIGALTSLNASRLFRLPKVEQAETS